MTFRPVVVAGPGIDPHLLAQMGARVLDVGPILLVDPDALEPRVMVAKAIEDLEVKARKNKAQARRDRRNAKRLKEGR